MMSLEPERIVAPRERLGSENKEQRNVATCIQSCSAKHSASYTATRFHEPGALGEDTALTSDRWGQVVNLNWWDSWSPRSSLLGGR
jgi:hypothetical protein